MNNKKINDRIMDMFNAGEFDDDFINLELDNFIKMRLHSYQHLHVYNMISCLKKNDVVIDGSNTGTGKTWTSLAVIKQLNLRPLIICPKGIINIWIEKCNYFNIVPLAVVNYEMIKGGYVYDKSYNKIKCSFLDVKNDEYHWNFNNIKNTIVIFDEAHKCRNKSTLNSKLLLSLKNITKIMLLSATLCDDPENFKVFGYMLGYYDKLNKGKKWIEGIIREQTVNKNKQNILYKYLYPSKGSRMTVQDIGSDYPMNQISVDCFDINSEDVHKINSSYKKINTIIKNKGADFLIKLLRERQQIELIKIPMMINLIEKYIEHNKSIVVFVNYIESLNKIIEYLQINNIEYCKIDGSQTREEREENINKFQSNKIKIIICTIQSGGVSINLHDESGDHPRVSIISPSFSSTQLVQALGRICRCGSKSPVYQIILFCAGTVEKNISDIIRKKIKFIDRISDDDLYSNIFE